MRKDRTTGHRRSARISALEEKARILALEKLARSNASISSSPPPPGSRKRGRKCKSLQAVVVNSVTTSPHQKMQSLFDLHLKAIIYFPLVMTVSLSSFTCNISGYIPAFWFLTFSCEQEGEDSKHEDNAGKAELLEKSSSPQRLPKKQTLEFVLDILQRRDTEEIFAQPVDPEEVIGYYNIIKEPMDFGTMRAKLQEGLYTSLEQFERDVFLISSNAMKFNSSTTVYYTEARAISELAQRLFHSLRTEPENFQLEYSRTRRRPGRKAQSEAGGSHTKPAKPGSSNDGVSLNDPTLRRPTPAFLGPPYPKPFAGQLHNGMLSGKKWATSYN
ncbi:bromodomain-containing protein [Ricinus communis]|uniref:Bromodomain-containing protein n=1 Tax=Ricinus communis TaxID=3988 RepID=B9T3V8_RICCO|nr:bromodomain-containing protein [Ricinus communis]